MTDKSGTLQDQRNDRFSKRPANATATCPLTGPEVAIVPVRYALDRSRFDENPTRLKPLLKLGKWAALPSLLTRHYTLRQLHDVYVYVYDESAKTLHEYLHSGLDGTLTRIPWSDADIGQDERSSLGATSRYLLYPRTSSLHIGCSPLQWTWRVCEHMRSNPGSRALWMKALDLPRYCQTQSAPDTLPLTLMAEALADVDPNGVKDDQRLADSAIPLEAPYAAKAADVFWTGAVPDKDSALIIALEEPLSVLNDLGAQLAADQAAYQQWQEQHEHKIQIAQTVETLCGASIDPAKLPASVRGDAEKTREYQRDLDDCFRQRQADATIAVLGSMNRGGFTPVQTGAIEKEHAFKKKYGTVPSNADYEAWSARGKWRREIDLDGAHAYIQAHQKNGETLLGNVRNSQLDFQTWAVHIGTEPLKLFIDTGNPKTLHYLQMLMADLLLIYGQDALASAWLAKQDTKATSLFGLVRYGFSAGLKEALNKQADLLLNGLGDLTNLSSRAGELNSALNHDGFADKAWMRELKQPVKDTFKALRELASKEGKNAAQAILLALIPSDSRLAMGKQPNLVALMRNLLIGHVLINSAERAVIDAEVGKRLRTWKREWLLLNVQLKKISRRWVYPDKYGVRKQLAHSVEALQKKLRIHALKAPGILDYQNNKYAELMRKEIYSFAQSGVDVAKGWGAKAKAWNMKWGANAGAITWGVVMLNFINTALIYRDLSKGKNKFEPQDTIKIAYSMSYNFSMVMAIYVGTPWSIIKAAKPVLINGEPVGILGQTAAQWDKAGNSAWGATIRSFSVRMIGMGAFTVIAASLEILDINNELATAKNSEEQKALKLKRIAVFGMLLGGAAQLWAGLSVSSSAVTFVMNPWFAVAILVLGVIYLAATFMLNSAKHDGVGWWLRRCCWSLTQSERHPDTFIGHAEEKRSLLEIQLSPQVFVKSTVEQKTVYTLKGTPLPMTVQNGAWVQILLPSALRGELVPFNVIASYRPLNILPVKAMDKPVQDPFIDKGHFTNSNHFTQVNNRPHNQVSLARFPVLPPPGEDIVWQTWVPLAENADYIELQIWYPSQILDTGETDRGYLYQLKLERQGETAVDGLALTTLQVKASSRANAMLLAIADQ
ncbi:hypothetical protein SAMN03159355_05542 [Pseudomonas sp. NFPP10]|uniref:toxin VasX n=1 Tax=unclassified Pseudomonas TaxID=196821 RepID=UPI0008868639|nr:MULTISPECIES: toxin VasX [unclassified Pseudomonas]SDA34734.1 hypothetical protein SAMN03159465_06139 [Pseudomonas sp. NFPP12]SEM66236.1 hypothetical protein SAMN03159355_05542 [Pseudomonas sp. NFPP10]SFK27441.1 hypothetical protein SAMN03159416_05536 [Pseudomonas sp. NFPP08]SFN72900.1 hypothetical protein SAMN03159476_06139 [Pseudomonas sp. NFPP05]SFY05166.1 hypothetical protein SAMN03159479_05544 [Pseudomonas sp. NFPP09]